MCSLGTWEEMSKNEKSCREMNEQAKSGWTIDPFGRILRINKLMAYLLFLLNLILNTRVVLPEKLDYTVSLGRHIELDDDFRWPVEIQPLTEIYEKNAGPPKLRLNWTILQSNDEDLIYEVLKKIVQDDDQSKMIVRYDGKTTILDRIYSVPFCWQKGICHYKEWSIMFVFCNKRINNSIDGCRKIDEKTKKEVRITPNDVWTNAFFGVRFAEGRTTMEQEGGSEAEQKMYETDQKRMCHYRISCYKQKGFHHLIDKQRQKRGRGGTVLSAKLTPPAGYKRTMKQVAHMAVRGVEKKEAERKTKQELDERDGETVLANYWSERERKIGCKYRKSCYRSGKLPKIERSTLLNWFGAAPKVEEDGRESKKEVIKTLDGMDEYERKLFCRYRRSCYGTGIRTKKEADWKWDEFELDFGIKEKINEQWAKLKKILKRKKAGGKEEEEEENEWEDPQRKLECKYRRSCYETGELPEALRPPKTEEKMVREGDIMGGKRVPTSVKELKLFCKYRKSCYVASATAARAAAAASEMESIKRMNKNETEKSAEREQQFEKRAPKKSMLNSPKGDSVREKEMRNEIAPKRKIGGRKAKTTTCSPEKPLKDKKEESKVKMSPKIGRRRQSKLKKGQEDESAKKEERTEDVTEKAEEFSKEKKTAETPIKKEKKPKKKYQMEESAVKMNEKTKVWSRKWEGLPKEARLKCRYRKSCYATGIIPKQKDEDWWTFRWNFDSPWPILPSSELHEEDGKIGQKWSEIDEWDQLNDREKRHRCKYRKSCYEWISNRRAEKEESNRRSPDSAKKKEGKPKKASDFTPKTVAREVDKKKREDILRREALFKSVDLETKLHCKYRKSCYVGKSLSIGKKSPINVVPRKNDTELGTMTPPGQKCNQWRISCREAMGLPIREKAPIGPSGKKLCRKKKMDDEEDK